VVALARPLEGGRAGRPQLGGGGLGCLCRASNRPTIYGMARGCHRVGEHLGETCGHVARVDRRRGHAGIMGEGL